MGSVFASNACCEGTQCKNKEYFKMRVPWRHTTTTIKCECYIKAILAKVLLRSISGKVTTTQRIYKKKTSILGCRREIILMKYCFDASGRNVNEYKKIDSIHKNTNEERE